MPSLFFPRRAGFMWAVFALSPLLLAAGCAPTRYGAARLSSTPPGAEVLDLKDRSSLGLTPLIVTWESDKGEPEHVTLRLRKTGYQEESASFWLNTRYETPEDARSDPQPVHVILREAD